MKTASVLRNTARYFLLVVGILVFIFALLSGAEGHGGGLKGILHNSPNATPWLLLLILLYVAWRRELIGGILISSLGILVMIWMVPGANFFWAPLIISLILILMGSFFILSWYLRSPRQVAG